jgi:4-hydroxy-tetrahydrodipicolinate synthase
MMYKKSDAKTFAREHMVGLWAAITYPFDASDELDEAGLRANIDHMIDNGLVDGLFCGHFMSEFWSLTHAERKRAAEAVVDQVDHRVPVVVQTGHHSVRESIIFTEHAAEIGAEFVAIGNPYFLYKNDEAIAQYFLTIADASDLGILVSNTSYTGISLGPELLNRLADHEAIVAVKNPQPLSHTMETLRLAGDRVIISDPNEANLFMLMAHFGFRLYTSSPVPYLCQKPGYTPVRDYMKLVEQGKLVEASKLSYSIEPLRNLMRRWFEAPWMQRGELPIAYVKVWSEFMGMAGGAVRAPLSQVSEEERQALRGDLEELGLVEGK